MITKVMNDSLLGIFSAMGIVFVVATAAAVVVKTKSIHPLTPTSSETYWPHYSGNRKVYWLDGVWNTSRLLETDSSSSSSFDSMDPNLKIESIVTCNLTTVPSTVDNSPPGYLGYRGVSFFRTHIVLPTTRSDVENGGDSSFHQHNQIFLIESAAKADTKATTSDIASARIQFQACSFYCRVWINNMEVGDHKAGGYVAWWLNVPSHVLAKGQQLRVGVDNNDDNDDGDHPFRSTAMLHELFVLVDNRWNATTAPMHTGGDFWHYGGILRSVEWHVLPRPVKELGRSRIGNTTSLQNMRQQQLLQDPEVWPWRLYVFPQKDLRSVRLQLQLIQQDYTGMVDSIGISFDRMAMDKDCGSTSTIFLSGHVTASDKGLVDLGIIQVPSPRVWSTHDPQLHTVSVCLHGAIVTERFGLRYWDTTVIRMEDGTTTTRIRLNGQVLKLVGWNHHTQWPYTAASPTAEQLDADIKLLKEDGHVNFVRGAHYPQDPRWLDRMDETGIVMWCETLGPGTSVHNLQDEYFLMHQHQQIHEMLDNSMNHASIAFWAFFNEGPSHMDEACPGYQESSKAIQARDTTRFVTYASNQYLVPDKCHQAASVISYNGYPGWYQTGDPVEWWTAIASNASFTEKPFLISETGAGGIYEWKHNQTVTKWTLEYQSQIIQQDVNHAIANPNISGIALWHFFDFKVNDQWENNTHCDYLPNVEPPTCGYIKVDTSRAGGRPGGLNHKGVLDFYRRPKPVFSIIAAKYKSVTNPD